MAPASRARWLQVRDRIHSTRITWSIGSDTVGDDLFGEILSARMDSDGRLVVLDSQNGTVRMFREPGELVGQFGDLYEGPTSLRYSRAISPVRDDTIAVYLAPQRVKYFVDQDSGWHLTGSADLPVTVESTCAMDDGRVFVQGNPIGGILGDHSALFYQMPQTETALRPFGRPYSGNWSAAATLSLGLVVCFDGLDRVIFAHTLLPLVQAFSTETADVLWRSRPGDHVQVPVTEYRSARRVDYDWLLGDALLVAAATTPHHVLLQYERPIGASETVLRSYLLDAMTGHGGFVGERLPRIASFHAEGYIATFEDPFPRIEVRHFITESVNSGGPPQ